MENGKEDFSKWCRRFEVTVEATLNYDEDSLAKLLPHTWVVLPVKDKLTRLPGEALPVFAAEIR